MEQRKGDILPGIAIAKAGKLGTVAPMPFYTRLTEAGSKFVQAAILKSGLET